MSDLLYLLACYGLTFTLCDAKLFTRLRDLLCRWKFARELLSCYFCTGFWLSMVLCVPLFWGSFVDGYMWQRVVAVIAYGFAGAAFSYFLDAVIVRLEGTVTINGGIVVGNDHDES